MHINVLYNKKKWEELLDKIWWNWKNFETI